MKSIYSTALKACEKNNVKVTSPLILAPAQLPAIPSASGQSYRKEVLSVAAKTRVTTRKRTGLVEDTSIASICSVTFIDPN